MTWQPIETCPLRVAVDLWCIYGDEAEPAFPSGIVVGELVSSRFKHPQFGFFGNQSNGGVPRGDSQDLTPVAWRPAVPDCPVEIIAAFISARDAAQVPA